MRSESTSVRAFAVYSESRTMKYKVLIIDDDPALIKMWSRLLNKNEFEVMGALTGPEGIRLTREENPATIILDLMMPEMNGWEICSEIRKFSDIPILVYSGLGDPETRESILALGANSFLTKPASIDRMTLAIKELIR